MRLRQRVSLLNISTSKTAAKWAGQKRKGEIWWFVVSPLHAFIDAYVWKAKWKQGIAGLTSSVLRSYRIFLAHSKLWELRNGLAKVANSSGRHAKRANKTENG